MSPYVVHRDPRWYPEPDRFDPDRWLPESVATRAEIFLFPVRRRRQSLHRRAIRLDGRRPVVGNASSKMALASFVGSPGRNPSFNHAASEIRHADGNRGEVAIIESRTFSGSS